MTTLVELTSGAARFGWIMKAGGAEHLGEAGAAAMPGMQKAMDRRREAERDAVDKILVGSSLLAGMDDNPQRLGQLPWRWILSTCSWR